MTWNQFDVPDKQNKTRIDKLLASLQPEYSRSQIQSWIEQGLVQVNGDIVKANYKCETDDHIKWDVPEVKSDEIIPENIPLNIVFEDSDVLVVNKPKGMVVHPAAGHTTGTLVHALLYHYPALPTVNGMERAGIVHRIDKDTSGLLVVAKTDLAYTSLTKQLQAKDVERKYEAIVHGVIEHETGLIDAPIARDPINRQKMGVVDQGKPATTRFKVIKHYRQFTHVECQLETGRTHQIRIHLRYIGFPLVGDPKYGPRKTLDIGGQALHAKTLGFTHPRKKEWFRFEEEVPAPFYTLLQQIEKMS